MLASSPPPKKRKRGGCETLYDKATRLLKQGAVRKVFDAIFLTALLVAAHDECKKRQSGESGR